jgi:hypothetical protein
VIDPEPLYLSYGLPDGTEHRVSLDPPRDGLRLAVGSLNRRSSIWRAYATRNDVYITAMGLNQSQKLSLHESGTWRMAYLDEGVAERLGATGKPEFNHDPRVIDRWEAPEGAAGWMHAFTVWVPHGHLTPLPDEVDNLKKSIIWLPEPGEGEAVGIHFAVVRPDEGTFDPTKMIPMAGFRLPNQRALIVLTSRRTHEPGRAQWLRDMAVAGLVLKQGNHVTHFGDPLRIGLFARDDENRGVWDLRAPQLKDLERVNREGLTVSKAFTPIPSGKKN